MTETDTSSLLRIADAVPIALYTFRRAADGTPQFLYVSPGFERLYGMPAAEILSDATRILTLIDADDLHGVHTSIDESARALTDWQRSFRIRHPVRGEVWIEGLSRPEPDPDGGVRWAGMLTDVTAVRAVAEERKRIHARLAEQARLLDIAFDAILVWELDGGVTYWNEGATRTYGYSAAEAVGLTSHSLLQTQFPQPLDQVLRDLRETGSWSGTVTHRRKDGCRLVADCRMQLVVGAAGQVLVLESNRDSTERARAEQVLAARTADLERANAELEQFSYVASHDLQEPLRGVIGCVQLLERRCQDQLDARGQEYIRLTVDAAGRMQQLIDDLLTFSRARTHSRTHVGPTSLDEALDRAVRNLQPLIHETGAVITREPLPVADGEATLVTSVFQNLLGNALKFRRELPPRVHVGAAAQDGMWLLSVRDNGIGIDPRFIERIFGIFQRLHTRGEYPGTGMGLALCRKIVERFGGRIWAESEPGHGSTFWLLWPKRLDPSGEDIRE